MEGVPIKILGQATVMLLGKNRKWYRSEILGAVLAVVELLAWKEKFAAEIFYILYCLWIQR